jgi:hypothetical protein
MAPDRRGYNSTARQGSPPDDTGSSSDGDTPSAGGGSGDRLSGASGRCEPGTGGGSEGRPSSASGPGGADRAIGRRGLLLGGAGLAAALGGGWYLFLRDEAGPDETAEEFVVSIDEESFSDADELIHRSYFQQCSAVTRWNWVYWRVVGPHPSLPSAFDSGRATAGATRADPPPAVASACSGL